MMYQRQRHEDIFKCRVMWKKILLLKNKAKFLSILLQPFWMELERFVINNDLPMIRKFQAS